LSNSDSRAQLGTSFVLAIEGEITMRLHQYRARAFLPIALLFGLLAACGTVSPKLETGSSAGFIVTLNITSQEDQANLEQKYSGEMLVFEPESGFAILRTTQRPGSSDASVKSVQEDQVTQLPETQTSSQSGNLTSQGVSSGVAGSHAWSSGSTAWSGGWSYWGSGWGAWGGGSASWSGGSSSTAAPAPPVANQAIWHQIHLDEAQPLLKKFGAGVKVAVIDTGIDLEHPIFKNRLASRNEWQDFVDGDRIPKDEPGGDGYGHGTAVAGIIAQVAPRATILPIRVLGSNGGGQTANVIAAIGYAVKMRADIINLSLGTNGFDAALFEICKFANKRGVRIVASAGNNGLEDGVTSPAQFSKLEGTRDRTIGIGSVNSSDSLSSFSAYGRGLYAVAPGERIATAFPDRRITLATGTSFAAPMFTGALALAESERPSISKGNRLEGALWSSLDFTVSDKIKLEKGIDTLTPRLQVNRLLHPLNDPNDLASELK
jgi:thermitase